MVIAQSRWLVISAAALAAALALLGACQLILPGLAARRLRDRLSREGVVESVRVHAFPAIELLWGHAGSVSVRLSQLHVDRAQTGDLLASATQTNDLDLWIGTLSEGPLVLHGVTLHKRGAQLQGQADLAESDLRAALPPGLAVQPVASGGGRLVLRAQASVLGLGIGVDALLSASDGALVIAPVGIPFGALATLTVFSDPRVVIEGVGARLSPGGYVLTAQARLRGG